MLPHNFGRRWNEKALRVLNYKKKNSLSSLELMRRIFLRVMQNAWDKVRRYFLLVNPSYDFYGWKTRALETAGVDLFSVTAKKKKQLHANPSGF